MSIAMIRAQKFTVLTEQRRVVAALLIAATATIAGCASHNEGAATPVSTSSSSTSAVTAAPPPGIGLPDLSALPAVDGTLYPIADTPRVQGFAFTTGDGLRCSSNAYPTPETEWVRCWGPRPDKGPGIWSVRAERNATARVEHLDPNPDFEAPASPAPPQLPPSTKVTAMKGDAVCAVTDNDLTACRVGGHGFVLTPTTTTLF